VDSGAPDGPTYVVGWSASGPDSLVLFMNYSVVPGNTCDSCDGLCVTLDCPAWGVGWSDRGPDGSRSCADGPAVLRVDPPFSYGRPGYESTDIPEYGCGNSFVADVSRAFVSVPNLCDKKLVM
jgi:hypothetical protein